MPDTKITDERVPLPWEEAEPHMDLVTRKAAQQFVAIWQANKDRVDEELRWGEEVEYMLVDLTGGGARVGLRADEVLRRLGSETGGDDPTRGAGWRTEFGNMMIEGVTHPPFKWSLDELLKIEESLAWRRKEIARVAKEVDAALEVVTLSAFPLLGVPGCSSPAAQPSPDGQVSQSVLCPDETISPHPRYQTFTANYRKRKGCKVAAFIPKFGDVRRPPSNEDIAEMPFKIAKHSERSRDPVDGYIYMDSQAFGACQCCMQATFLTRTVNDARFLTDQFLVLAPLILALSAATPFLRGCVADTDTRWPTFKQTWDDRRCEELSSLKNSRTSANDLFIGLSDDCSKDGSANDLAVPLHQPTLQHLQAAGVDELMSRHIAHLLSRDALMVFPDRLDIDDGKDADHWEQIQGTNWGTVRFKPPPASGDIGWRVEFRSPDVQLTDFENAAIVAVLRLLAQAIVEEKWDLVIPISLCDANDEASASRDAASQGSFWFREDFGTANATSGRQAKQFLLRDILSGPSGIFTRLRQWLQRAGKPSPEVHERVESYFVLFERRAAGILPTPASLLRKRLQDHPEYRNDGAVPVSFVHELCALAVRAAGERPGDGGELSGLLG